MCAMCEAHVNDSVRKNFKVKKVSSSHTKGETIVITDEELDEAAVKNAIEATGYKVKSIFKEPYHKKYIFGF